MSSASLGALFTLSYDAAAAAAAELRRAVDGARLHRERGVSRLANDAIAAALTDLPTKNLIVRPWERGSALSALRQIDQWALMMWCTVEALVGAQSIDDMIDQI
jgi:hypothetical protein